MMLWIGLVCLSVVGDFDVLIDELLDTLDCGMHGTQPLHLT